MDEVIPDMSTSDEGSHAGESPPGAWTRGPVVIGVVMATYNRPDLVVRSLESLREQTYPHWRVYVVDDASEADYSAVHCRYAGDTRINFSRLDQNGGVGAARNLAIDCAQRDGVDYIAILDDDDIFVSDYFEVLVSMITRYPDHKWFWSNTFGDSKPVSRRIEQIQSYDYIDDRVYGKMRGDKTNVISSKVIGERRYNTRKRTEDRQFYLHLAKQTRVLGFPHDSKQIAYQATGFTKNKQYPRNVYEIIYKFTRHWGVIKMRPGTIMAYRYFFMELAKTPGRFVRYYSSRVFRK